MRTNNNIVILTIGRISFITKKCRDGVSPPKKKRELGQANPAPTDAVNKIKM